MIGIRVGRKDEGMKREITSAEVGMLTTISRSVPRFTLIEDDPDLLYQVTCAVNLSRVLVKLDIENTKSKSYHLNLNP